MELLLSMGPSAIDAELHLLDPNGSEADGSALLAAMLDYLLEQLASRKNFELNQAILARLLEVLGSRSSRV